MSGTNDGAYVPNYHKAKPIGYEHDTIFASVELWADDPPERIAFGDLVYALERTSEKNPEKSC